MGGNGGQSFIGEMNCPSESDQIRNRFGCLVRFSSGGKQLLHSVPFVSLVTLVDTYVSRYRSYPPIRRRSSFPLVLSDDPIPSPNHFSKYVSLPATAERAQVGQPPLIRSTVRLIPIIHYRYDTFLLSRTKVWGEIQYSH
jgi:hypothetical protein